MFMRKSRDRFFFENAGDLLDFRLCSLAYKFSMIVNVSIWSPIEVGLIRKSNVMGICDHCIYRAISLHLRNPVKSTIVITLFDFLLLLVFYLMKLYVKEAVSHMKWSIQQIARFVLSKAKSWEEIYPRLAIFDMEAVTDIA